MKLKVFGYGDLEEGERLKQINDRQVTDDGWIDIDGDSCQMVYIY